MQLTLRPLICYFTHNILSKSNSLVSYCYSMEAFFISV